jgi:hypothetical protein
MRYLFQALQGGKGGDGSWETDRSYEFLGGSEMKKILIINHVLENFSIIIYYRNK